MIDHDHSIKHGSGFCVDGNVSFTGFYVFLFYCSRLLLPSLKASSNAYLGVLLFFLALFFSDTKCLAGGEIPFLESRGKELYNSFASKMDRYYDRLDQLDDYSCLYGLMVRRLEEETKDVFSRNKHSLVLRTNTSRIIKETRVDNQFYRTEIESESETGSVQRFWETGSPEAFGQKPLWLQNEMVPFYVMSKRVQNGEIIINSVKEIIYQDSPCLFLEAGNNEESMSFVFSLQEIGKLLYVGYKGSKDNIIYTVESAFLLYHGTSQNGVWFPSFSGYIFKKNNNPYQFKLLTFRQSSLFRNAMASDPSLAPSRNGFRSAAVPCGILDPLDRIGCVANWYRMGPEEISQLHALRYSAYQPPISAPSDTRQVSSLFLLSRKLQNFSSGFLFIGLFCILWSWRKQNVKMR